jgi:hypothetical protein
MIYLPDLLLTLGIALCLLLGWRRGPGGYTRPIMYWGAVEAFVVRFDRRLDDLAWGGALILLGGLALWLIIGGLAAGPGRGRVHPAWGVAAALAAGLALLNVVLAADAVFLALSWLAAALAVYAVNLLALADEDADAGAARRLLPGLGAMLAAGTGVLLAALAAARVGAGGYDLAALPWPALGDGPALVLVGVLLVQLGQLPLLGASLHGAAISRGVLVPLPALYLALRLWDIGIRTPGSLVPAWATAWAVLAVGGALGGGAALLAWGAQPPDRRLALASAAHWGLVVWGLGLATPLSRTAAITLALATALGHLGLDSRLGRWRLAALASLGGVPLLAGFGGVWLLGQALPPGLRLVALGVVLGGTAALLPGFAAAPRRPALAGIVGGVIATGLLAAGVLPGWTLLPGAVALVGALPPGVLAVPDWGLAGLGGPGMGAWPAAALAALLGLALAAGLYLAWRRRGAPPPLPGWAWRIDDDALVPVAQALLIDRPPLPSAVPGDAPAPPPTLGAQLTTALARGLSLLGQALVAAEGRYYLLFTVLMLLLALLALTR